MGGLNSPYKRPPTWLERARFALLGDDLRLNPPDLTRLVIWLPVAFGIGITTYFAFESEPGRIWGYWGLLTSLIAISLSVFVRRSAPLLFSLLMLATACVGFSHAQYRAHSLIPPALELSDRAINLEGWIEAVERIEPRTRLRIRVAHMDASDESPRRVRVLSDLDGFRPGDAVKLRAVLRAPPGPVAAGSYDGARVAYFDALGLTGFAITELETNEMEQGAHFERWLALTRWQIGQRVLQAIEGPTAGLARALLTGDRAYVDGDDRVALQGSGLGHILAISGLHMALFAGGAYWLFRLAIAALSGFARAHDPRKIAAIGAIIVASAYLLLSGASVPTQRAWIMTIVVLIGVFLDRRAFTFQSLSIAGLIILLIAPQSVTEVGFQMSFAAVAALIAVYEALMRFRRSGPKHTIQFRAIRSFIEGLVVTSLIAGAATGIFAGFHFQRMSSFGFFANLAAMPIFTFWVMPMGAIALALMPFSLEGWALSVMAPGLDLILTIAEAASQAEGARVDLRAPSGAVIAVFALGFAALTLGLGSVRLVGSAVCALALTAWSFQSPPDLMVTEQGIIIARSEQADVYEVNQLTGRFGRSVMIQRAGGGVDTPERFAAQCDPNGCVAINENALVLAFSDRHEALEEDCALASVIVFQGQVSSWQRRHCSALIIDDQVREQQGGLEFWIDDGAIQHVRSAVTHRGQRLWTNPQVADQWRDQ